MAEKKKKQGYLATGIDETLWGWHGIRKIRISPNVWKQIPLGNLFKNDPSTSVCLHKVGCPVSKEWKYLKLDQWTGKNNGSKFNSSITLNRDHTNNN